MILLNHVPFSDPNDPQSKKHETLGVIMPTSIISNRKYFCSALRSGRYNQTTGGIGKWNAERCQYCALGVGVAIGLLNIDTYLEDTKAKLMIHPWAIIMMNDYQRFSFNQIADYVERLETDHVVRFIPSLRRITGNQTRAV